MMPQFKPHHHSKPQQVSRSLRSPYTWHCQRHARHRNMMKGLFSLPDRWAAAAPTACLAFCASVFEENAGYGSISPWAGSHGR